MFLPLCLLGMGVAVGSERCCIPRFPPRASRASKRFRSRDGACRSDSGPASSLRHPAALPCCGFDSWILYFSGCKLCPVEKLMKLFATVINVFKSSEGCRGRFHFSKVLLLGKAVGSRRSLFPRNSDCAVGVGV